MKGDGAEDSIRENKRSSSVKESGTPAEKVFVHQRNEKQTIRDIEFIGREWKAMIDLGEGGDRSAKVCSQIISQLVRDSNR